MDPQTLLTPEDYIANVASLVPLLKARLQHQYIRVVVRASLEAGPVEVNSDTFSVVPIAEFQPHAPRYLAQVIVHLYDRGDLARGPHPWETTYWLDATTVNKWSPRHSYGPVKEWIRIIRAKKFMLEAERRLAPIKEELMAAAWSPQRVERLLAASGYEALD